MRKPLTALLIVLLPFAACKVNEGQQANENPGITDSNSFVFMFYNVENLFDTEDDPEINDDEFTPVPPKFWDNHKYEMKLKLITKVVLNTGWDVPVFIGLCEVENRKVLEDLTKKTALSKFNYGIIHEDSPDHRGIDVALLYQKDIYRPVFHTTIGVRFPFEPETTTRDILYSKGTVGEDTFHIFVNHWPSRRGGPQASEPKRLEASMALRKITDSLFHVNANSKIIITGDFNDGPENNSLTKKLGAVGSIDQLRHPGLYNYMARLKSEGHGTHKYQMEWNTLDQFIVSSGLLRDTSGIHATEESAMIFKAGFLLEKDPFNPGFKPYRTYAGPRYLGGYSDHLPILLKLKYQP